MALQVKKRFQLGAGEEVRTLWVKAVWGVEPLDNGNGWDPYSYPRPPLRSVDLAAPVSQVFLRRVCTEARHSEWYDSERSPHNCTLERVIESMVRTHAAAETRASLETCGISARARGVVRSGEAGARLHLCARSPGLFS